MAAQSKQEPGRQPEPWYRSTAAVSTAGLVGVALVGGLVYTVVDKSDQWSRPPTMSTVLTTVPTTQQTLRTTEPFIVTPSSETSTFPTSVRLSTTDIGVPGESTTTDSSETSPSESPTTRRTPRTQENDESTTTTTRKRPRLNQTRTLSP
ncbi:hypothetical protein BH11ACT6_BH11ACT6_37370 [soil metagenome]